MCLITDTSCQNQKSKNLNFQYIYLISYKNAKKANPVKWIRPHWKTISQQFQGSDIYMFIADIQGVGLKISKLNRLDFMASIF